jgi:uncharacterized membrane protein
MSPVMWIIVLWIVFALTHVVPASDKLRPGLVRAVGERGYLGLYSLVALAAFVPLVGVYFHHRHSGPLLWQVGFSPLTLWLLYIAMGLAFVLIAASLVTPSPAMVGAENIPATQGAARGVHLIARHPLFMGLGLWGILHLIANGHASDVAFFAGFPLFALLGSWHQDRRKLKTGGENYRAFYEATPFLPFAGRQVLRGVRELSRVGLIVGILITVILRYFHQNLFGV